MPFSTKKECLGQTLGQKIAEIFLGLAAQFYPVGLQNTFLSQTNREYMYIRIPPARIAE